MLWLEYNEENIYDTLLEKYIWANGAESDSDVHKTHADLSCDRQVRRGGSKRPCGPFLTCREKVLNPNTCLPGIEGIHR